MSRQLIKSPHFIAESKALLLLTLPILLTQFAQAGYGLVDSIMASHVSPADLATVAVGVGLWFPIVLFTMGVLMATTPLIAHSFGAKQLQEIPTITQQSIWLALLLGIIAMGLLNLTPLLFDALHVPAHLRAKSILYLVGVSFSLPAIAITNALRSYVEAMGSALPITTISLIGLALLIPANYIFIYGFSPYIPAMGGAGCGIATAIVAWLTLLMLIVYLVASPKYAQLRFYQHWALPDTKIIGKILKIGLPIGIAIFFEASLFCFAALILSPLGERVIAAHQIALSVTSILFMIPLSLSMALTIRTGQRFGAGAWDQLIIIRKLGFWLATAFAITTMVGLALFRHNIVQYYTGDTVVQDLASQLLICAMLYQVVDAWQVTAAGCLRGMQDTKITMWITLCCYWLIALPLGIYLSRYTSLGALGFWGALVLGLTLAAGLLRWRLGVKERVVTG